VLCESAYKDYKGENPCAYSIAMALVESHEWLTTKVSPDSSTWLWSDLHVNEYPNLPWSKTPLKFLFHRTIGVPGNDNTPHVSKTSARKNAENTVI